MAPQQHRNGHNLLHGGGENNCPKIKDLQDFDLQVNQQEPSDGPETGPQQLEGQTLSMRLRFSLGCRYPASECSFLMSTQGRQQVMAQTWVPAMHMGDLD